jgi:hypothetical protein
MRGGIGVVQDEPRSGRKGNISTDLLRQMSIKALGWSTISNLKFSKLEDRQS